jgi:hypothetical protein
MEHECKCPDCNGYGDGEGFNFYTKRPARFVCGTCHGTGKIPLEQAVKRLLENAGLDASALCYEVEQAR